MSNKPQDVEAGALRQKTIELAGAERGTRIRLSADILGRLDWWEFEQGPFCWGVFRLPGELLCAPKELAGQNGQHPFADILDMAAMTPDASEPQWSRIPPARVITAPDRLIAFSTAWTANQKQLSLKIGRDVARRLGWSESNSLPIYASNWARILILMSETVYESTQRQELIPDN